VGAVVFNGAEPVTVPWSFTRGDPVTFVIGVPTLTANSYTITRLNNVEVATINSAFDLTGKTFEAAISQSYGLTVLATLTVTHNDDGGEMTFTLTQAASEALAAGLYVWEVVETTSGSPVALIRGRVTVLEGVVAR
jgi:hypothetical protein